MMTGELYPGEFEAMEHNGQMDAVADNGLQDLIDELREYGIARKGELAGMVLKAANQLEWLAEERDQMVAFIARTNERLNTIVEIQGSWLRRQKRGESEEQA